MSLYEDFFLTMLVKTIRMCFRLKKVFFENSYGDKRLIGQSKDKEDAFRIIDNFLKGWISSSNNSNIFLHNFTVGSFS